MDVKVYTLKAFLLTTTMNNHTKGYLGITCTEFDKRKVERLNVYSLI